MLQSASLSIKSRDQITQLGAPLWPADPQTFDYNGRDAQRLRGPDRRRRRARWRC